MSDMLVAYESLAERIGDDAAPRSERTIVLWNPPLQDAELGLRLMENAMRLARAASPIAGQER